MPLVTVVIPTHNRAEPVCRAVESVLDQTWRRMEIIVVDDGSTDDTAARLEALQSPMVRCLRSPVNRGVSAARNWGIRHGRGELVALLDSDDCWRPEKLSRQVEVFVRHPETLITQTEEIWIRDGVRVNPRRRHRKRQGDIFAHCLPRCIISPSAVMLRRRLFTAVGWFDERLPACEDYDLWLRVAARFPVHLDPEPLVVKYGGHADQLSRRIPALDRYRIAALLKLLDSNILDDRQCELTMAELRRKVQVYAAGCRKRGRTAEAADLAREVERRGGMAALDSGIVC
ncbi:MAG: glycosyltransferase family 2 protein [Deltaproteobacteria bacterium]|nr:glycosyltransferase family 2 protein [Candidatus Anaeroferrophillacea bacterium]